MQEDSITSEAGVYVVDTGITATDNYGFGEKGGIFTKDDRTTNEYNLTYIYEGYKVVFTNCQENICNMVFARRLYLGDGEVGYIAENSIVISNNKYRIEGNNVLDLEDVLVGSIDGNTLSVGETDYTIEEVNKVELDAKNRPYAFLDKSTNTYTFYQPGVYSLVYSISDSEGNISTKTIDIRVSDANAPVIEDTNPLKEGQTYYEVIYKAENTKLKFDSSPVCEGDVLCLKPLTAYDYEERVETIIDITSIKYNASKASSFGDASGKYQIERNEQSLFKISSISFTKTGYYEITMSSKDSGNRERKLKYIVRVIDNEAPQISIEGKVIENGDKVTYFRGLF